ncbi:MAG: hypothetical protein D6E12_02050 [Desulfovibrio sp.]|nr:MAG: hypothetical protein D6E12_02050 [Desulfovibrio sp.]
MSFSFGIAPLGGVLDQQTFGAQVVTKTMDYMNQQPSGGSLAPVDQETAGASLVTKTLDYMNSPSLGMGSVNTDYGFQTTVLSAYGMSGALANLKV